MKTKAIKRFRPALLTMAIAATFGSPPVMAQGETTRVSVASDGTQANYGSIRPATSANGRFVCFLSDSSNIAPDDSNGISDIFVHDQLKKTTARVSLASDGAQANDASLDCDISGDGRFVAFMSYASNLVPDDTNGKPDIFVNDRTTLQTTLVSIASDGTQANNYSARSHISSDGRFVVFRTRADNLVPGDTNSELDVFVHDRLAKTTTRVSVASDGAQGIHGNPDSYYDYNTPTISANGRFVAFSSFDYNLVPVDTNENGDTFVHDRHTGETTRVSIASDGTQANGWSGAFYGPDISSDGRFVAFESVADNLVPGDTNDNGDVFVHDRSSGQTTRVSVNSEDTEANGFSRTPSLSGDGRFVVFTSIASNLVPGDTNNIEDAFVHDRHTGETTRINVATDGTEANYFSATHSISADGRFVAFDSGADNLVSGDTNGFLDIFVRDRLLLPDQSADLAVSQTRITESLLFGDPLSYTVTVHNRGVDPAGNVSLTDLLPSNALLNAITPSQGRCSKGPVSVCRLGSLAAGGSATVNVSLTANSPGVFKNTAFVNAPPVDNKPRNNTSAVTIKLK